MNKNPIVRVLACAVVVSLAGTGLARAQQAARNVDERWLPWLGCWELLQDGDTVSLQADELRVCVEPAPEGGVTMTTRSGDTAAFAQTIVADGFDRPVGDPACVGTERAEWSLDGTRLFAHAELACGAQPLRRVSGLTVMAAGGTWLDVQAVEIEGQESVRVRRYRRAADQSPVAAAVPPALLDRAGTASFAAGSFPFTIATVIEASRHVAAAAIEAALLETRPRLVVNRDTLVRLDEAGVDDGVVDLMVALAYPDRFVLERPDSAPVVSYTGRVGGSYGFDPLWYGLDGFGPDYYYYYYAPFGYSAWGRYNGYSPYYYRGNTFTVGPGGRPGGGVRDDSPGRVVNGRGYTRVRPRTNQDSEPATSSRGGSRGGRSSSGGASAESSGGSSGGTATPQGASSGGSESGGRTAVPR
jgi:hypothetical protein